MAEDGILAFKFDKFDDSAEKEFDFWASSTNIIRDTQNRDEGKGTVEVPERGDASDFDSFQFEESFDLF